MSNQFQRWIVQEVMKPIVLLGSGLNKLNKILFGRYQVNRSKKDEDQLAQEIQADVPFLFSEHGGRVVPDETVRYPRPFDYASVIVEVYDLRFRFFRGRGDLRVQVAPKHAPNDWRSYPWCLA
jgi:hypothetical protein